MIIQWILTIALLAAALAFAVVRIIRYFKKPEPGQSTCEHFSGDCAACLKSSQPDKDDCHQP